MTARHTRIARWICLVLLAWIPALVPAQSRLSRNRINSRRHGDRATFPTKSRARVAVPTSAASAHCPTPSVVCQGGGDLNRQISTGYKLPMLESDVFFGKDRLRFSDSTATFPNRP